MNNRFDGDSDDVIEPDEPDTEYETAFDTAPAVPEASVPEPPAVGSGDGDAPIADYDAVDPELRKGFWTLVFVVKFALLSLTLGALFLYFEGRVGLGGQLLAFGTVLGLFGAYRYRIVKERLEGDEFDDPNPEPDDSDENEKHSQQGSTSRKQSAGADGGFSDE